MKRCKQLLFISFFLHSLLYAQITDNLSKGNEFYRNAEFDLAEKQYRIAVEKGNETFIAQYNLANALLRQKKYKEATGVLQNLLQTTSLPDTKAAVHYNQGVVYTKQQDLLSSIEAYKNALRIDPEDVQARENLQKALLELKKQQQDKKSQPKPQPSKMSQKEAQNKLDQLQQKEKELQERLQKNNQKGNSLPKDW
ncbi:MAG: tetratricopeptide repeat protein [Chitinophagaceae bacterium]